MHLAQESLKPHLAVTAAVLRKAILCGNGHDGGEGSEDENQDDFEKDRVQVPEFAMPILSKG